MQNFVNAFDEVFGQTFKTSDMASISKNVNSVLYNTLNVSYPPYNIRKISEGHYVLEIVAAGYSMDEFLIELEDRTLNIECNPVKPVDNFLFQGLSYKKWLRTFTLAPGVAIKGAELVNGILRVLFDSKTNLPKKVKINISQPTAKSNPQLLNEDSVM